MNLQAIHLAVLMICSTTARGGMLSYHFTDLGTLGGSSSLGCGINSLGQVVGYSDTNFFGDPRAFVFSNGVMTSLGAFPGGNFSIAYGINASGHVVGESTATTN